MSTLFRSFEQIRLADEVLTNVVLGYKNADSIANFVAPVVTVPTRGGLIKKFGKENFAVVPTRRSPYDTIKRISSAYTTERYQLEQHAIAGEISYEEAEEAIEGQAEEDLRKLTALRAAEAISQSWEDEIATLITNGALYEANLQQALAGTAQFDDPASRPELTIDDVKEAVRSQIGVPPNAAVCDVKTFRGLQRNETFNNRIAFTNPGSVTEEMLANWFGLKKGLKVAYRKRLDEATGDLVDIMPEKTMVVFYHPEGTSSNDDTLYYPDTVFMNVHGNNRAIPAAFYTYQRKGYPIAGSEQFDENTRTWWTPVIAEQSIIPVGLGSNGLIGAAYLLTDTVS